MKLVSNSPNFAGTKPIKILGKDNKHVKYLYNDVTEVVKKNKVPAVFETGSTSRIVLNPATEKVAKIVSENLKKLGIVINTSKK